MSWAQSLVKLSAYEVEILQKRLAEIAARQAAAAEVLQALKMEEALESAHAHGDAEAGWYLIGFRDGLKRRRSKVVAEQNALSAEAQGCRDALQEAFEAQKKYEQVLEGERLQRAKVSAQRDAQAMDAAALRAASVERAA